MSYIGNTPTTQSFISGTDYFNGTGSQTAFTLSRTVASINDIQVTVNNVVQQPNDAYTISGTTLTMTSAPSAGTNNVYVRYLSTTTQAITPSQGTVSWSTLNSDVQQDLGISYKNRIINGNMAIDQRNAGASVTPTGTQYITDRWALYCNQSSKFSVQQNAGAVTPPVGFTNYLGATSLSAYSVGSSDFFMFGHRIEGFNTADLGWGTANAKTVTISFWVRSSLTGTFGGSFVNSAGDRSYPFTYTISAANTWEQKSITVAGDTSGTWLTTNGIGISVYFGLGTGSTWAGTAGSWSSNYYFTATGATSVVGTNGATFYLTGVQLEVGTQATTFTTAGGSYGAELALCQRYFCSSFSIGTAPAQNAGGGMIGKGANGATAEPILTWSFPVSMRAAPTVTTYNPSAANNQWSAGTAPRVVTSSTSFASIDNTGNPVTAGTQSYINASASIEL